MKFDIKGTRVIVTADNPKERYRTESAFFYALKLAMQKAGLDVIKKRMEKDGHMMGDSLTMYIRERKWNFAVVDDNWMLRAVEKDFNTDRSVTLTFVDWLEQVK